MYKIASIAGDGIGPEIVAEGKKVLEATGEKYNFDIQWTDFDIGADRYLATGELVTEDNLKELKKFRAIYFGAIGEAVVALEGGTAGACPSTCCRMSGISKTARL